MCIFSGDYLLGNGFYLEEQEMDKGFNDDELADIMNEIESLEEEFKVEENLNISSIKVSSKY